MGFSALVSISHPELVLAADYLTALGMLALATMLALAVRWEEVRPAWSAVVPVLDMGAVALARDAAREHTIAVSLLMRVPTLWLAARLRRNGVLIAVACTLVMISLPSLVRASHIDSLVVAHSLVLPFIVLQIGVLTVGALTVMDGRNQQLLEALTEKEALLESAAASERLLENVIDSVDVGIVVVDRDGHDVLMNRAQQRIHRLAPLRTTTIRTSPSCSCGIPGRLCRCLPSSARCAAPCCRRRSPTSSWPWARRSARRACSPPPHVR